MEHIPEYLRLKELWGCKDVDIEPGDGLDLFDSPFPFGVPPVVPDVETQIHDVLNEIADGLSIHSVEATQRYSSAPPDIKSLLFCDVSPTPSEMRVRRNLATGTLEGYHEVFTEEEAVEGDECAIDFTKDLLNVLPGLEEGMTFGTQTTSNEEEFSVRHILNLADVLSAGEPCIVDDRPNNKENERPAPSETLDDVELMKQLPLEPVTAVLNISSVVDEPKERLEWAQQVDISKPMLDFEDQVSDPAFKVGRELTNYCHVVVNSRGSQNSQ